MKKWAIGLLLLLAGCQQCKEVVKVAASPVPHAEILREIQSDLQEEGICLKIVEVDDYSLPNRLLAEGQVDANFFQHRPFLETQKEQFGYKLTVLTPVHLEPLSIYSKKITSLQDLTMGAKVAIPSDPTNEGRALELLEAAKLIELKPGRGKYPTPLDIVSNPYRLKIEEIDAAYLPRALPDVTIAVIPSNFALQAKLNPTEDALFQEGTDSPYVNVVVIREGDDREVLERLKSHLTSDKVKQFLLKHYQGSIIPASD